MRPEASAVRALARRDRVLGRALRELPAFPGFPDREHKRLGSHYEALARAIVFQQLHGKAAATIHRRVCALSPGERFPTPSELIALDAGALQRAGLSRNKLAALLDLARRIEDGRLVLSVLGRRTDQRIIDELSDVRGIGPWTAQMLLIFRLGRLDVMPSTDLGVQEGLRLLDGAAVRPTPREVLARTEIWKPLRSVGAWTMWRLVENRREQDAARADRADVRVAGSPSRKGQARTAIQ